MAVCSEGQTAGIQASKDLSQLRINLLRKDTNLLVVMDFHNYFGAKSYLTFI